MHHKSVVPPYSHGRRSLFDPMDGVITPIHMHMISISFMDFKILFLDRPSETDR